MSSRQPPVQSETLFGHPVGLFTLFFAEMWERFSYYGMRALLVFYMTKGFLGYGDSDAYAVYGAYCSLVYMTPFFGGMLADRLLGARRAVVFGGLLMAAGQMMLTVPSVLEKVIQQPPGGSEEGFTLLRSLAFFAGLALLITGNGFFKPNISTIVGSLYPQGSPRRDGGFTVFYMGINLGAAMSPLLCGFVGEVHGWHYGFGLATAGMLVGLAVFVAPIILTQLLIMTGAVAASTALCLLHPDNAFSTGVNVIVAVALLAAGVIACVALGRGGLPRQAGAPPDRQRLRRRLFGPISAEWVVYLATVFAVAAFILLVSGFAPLSDTRRPVSIVSEDDIKDMTASESPVMGALAVVLKEASRPAGIVLALAGIVAVGYLGVETIRLDKVPRERMYVVLILTFFSILFWAFFEQAGSSLNNFADRNVDRVFEQRQIAAGDVGKTIRIEPTQEQLGYHNGQRLFTLDVLDRLREQHKKMREQLKNDGNPQQDLPLEIDWVVAPDNVGMGIASRAEEMPASTFQSVNAIFILIFGPLLTALWALLAARRMEPSTPVKFAFGLLQLGLGFVAFWHGAQAADERGMVALVWLVVGYLLHTTGELCLSPVGLSMVTRLSPARLVSTVMGAWFLATAFAQFLAAIIAQFTDVTGAEKTIPVPAETVNVYGGVFVKIAIAAIASSLICFLLSPLLKRWMHAGADDGAAA